MFKVSHPIETRRRDVKRDRLLLTIGSHSWHLSHKEALQLANTLIDFVESPPPKPVYKTSDDKEEDEVKA